MATAGRQGASCWAAPGRGAGGRNGRTAYEASAEGGVSGGWAEGGWRGSSRMPSWAVAAATGLREGPEQGLPGPPRGPPPLGLAWSRTRGGSSCRGEALCLLGPQEGDAAGTQGHQLYCRVSTKASNSRTFFSCAASFSGSESCAGGRGAAYSVGREASC